MKVLILFSHAWRGGRSGGAETQALQLIKELAGRGHEIYFVASTGKQDTSLLPPGALAQYRLPFQSFNPLDKVQAFRQLLQIVERHKIELIHAHHRTGGYFAECLYRRAGVPYIVTVHDIWHRAPAKWVHGFLFRNLIAVSSFIKRGLTERFGFTPDRIQMIYNGVDPRRFESASDEEAAQFRARFGLGNAVVFSLVARVSRSKGHYDVIEALRLLPHDLPFICLFVGEGKELPKLRRMAVHYRVQDKLIFCGYQSEIPAVMRASDVILQPSHREPFGFATLEAMFSGKPLLVSASGGTTELVTDDREGIVFPVSDVAALAKGIERLTKDEGLRQRLGQQSHTTAYERFLLSKTIDETEAYYFDVVRAANAEHRMTA
jgi:glycosyltransferase involved in cell wall biosynthesis